MTNHVYPKARLVLRWVIAAGLLAFTFLLFFVFEALWESVRATTHGAGVNTDRYEFSASVPVLSALLSLVVPWLIPPGLFGLRAQTPGRQFWRLAEFAATLVALALASSAGWALAASSGGGRSPVPVSTVAASFGLVLIPDLVVATAVAFAATRFFRSEKAGHLGAVPNLISLLAFYPLPTPIRTPTIFGRLADSSGGFPLFVANRFVRKGFHSTGLGSKWFLANRACWLAVATGLVIFGLRVPLGQSQPHKSTQAENKSGIAASLAELLRAPGVWMPTTVLLLTVVGWVTWLTRSNFLQTLVPSTHELIDCLSDTPYFRGLRTIWVVLLALAATRPTAGLRRNSAQRLTALFLLMAVVWAGVVVCAVGGQLAIGYVAIDLKDYGIGVGLLLGQSIIWAAPVWFLVSALRSSVGAVVGCYFLLSLWFLEARGFNRLPMYGYLPPLRPLPLSGWEPWLVPSLWCLSFWGVAAMALYVISGPIFDRAVSRVWLKRGLPVVVVASLAFVLVGRHLWENDVATNGGRRPRVRGQAAEAYESKFGNDKEAVPTLKAVEAQIDFFQSQRRLSIRATYTLTNQQKVALPSLLVSIRPESKVASLTLDGRKPTLADRELGAYRFALDPPMAPGASGKLQFEVTYEEKGFELDPYDPSLLSRGIFLSPNKWPQLGRDPRRTFFSDARQIPLLARIAPLPEPITYSLSVSSDPGTRSVAPGKAYPSEGRGSRPEMRYEAKTNLFPAIASYPYDESDFAGAGCNVEVYTGAGEGARQAEVVEAAKRANDFDSANFGSCQNGVIRIAVVPNHVGRSRSTPGMILLAEDELTQPAGPKMTQAALLLPLTVMHEFAHQWWRMPFLQEAVAMYQETIVAKLAWGSAKAGFLLQRLNNDYLLMRGFEGDLLDTPLFDVNVPQDEEYKKGGAVFFALADYLGEDAVNSALAETLHTPAATAATLEHALRSRAPPSLKWLLDDLLDKSFLYDNKALAATATPTAGGYHVTLKVSSRKVNGTTLDEVPEVEDALPMGILDSSGEFLWSDKRKVPPGTQTIEVDVKGRPASAGIDPMHEFIDLDPADNVVDVVVAR